MKKYTYYFEFEKDKTTMTGNCSIVADCMISANRQFERLYTKEEDRSCGLLSKKAFVAGIEIHVTNIVENSNLN